MHNLTILPMRNPLVFVRPSPGLWLAYRGDEHLMTIKATGPYYKLTHADGRSTGPAFYSISGAKLAAGRLTAEGEPPRIPLIQFRLKAGEADGERLRLVVVNALPPEGTANNPMLTLIRQKAGRPVVESVPWKESRQWSSFTFGNRLRASAHALLDEVFPTWEQFTGRLSAGRHSSR